jgi:glutaminase
LKRVLEWDLTIPHYEKFMQNLELSYKTIKEDKDGEYSKGSVATYIPPLAKADPTWFSTSFCSSDAQFAQFGDTDKVFSI